MANDTLILTIAEKDLLVQQEAFDQGTKVAQIFSGIFFAGLAAWLTVSNGTKLAFVQRAALEKRLTVCCFLNVYVGFFSAFFNFFQLTSVDDMVLPHGSNFTLDLARPIEWLMTCPLMQLSLVLMGGSKIPEYRRYLMPAFSATILLLGTFASFFAGDLLGVKLAMFCLGTLIFFTMVYFNRMQVLEYSCDQEGLLIGDSEFRKATLLLIATWSPFPIWYFLSPEGVGLLDNVLIIQVGWAFLNIVAKFSFIFYVQRIKDMYCNRLKTKRELTGTKGGHASYRPRSGLASPMDGDFSAVAVPGYIAAQEFEAQDLERKRGQLSAIVVETMSFLGMAQHTERFLKLLDRANMNTIAEVEMLDKDKSAELQLPYELISALQRRIRVWKLEIVDDAEMGLDKGEEFYLKKGMNEPFDEEQALFPGMMPYGLPPLALEQTEELERARMEEIEVMLRKTEEAILLEARSKGDALDTSVAELGLKFQSIAEAMESRILARIGGDASSSASEGAAAQRFVDDQLSAKLEEQAAVVEQQRRHELSTLEARIRSGVEQQVALVASKVDVCCQKVDACAQKATLAPGASAAATEEVAAATRLSERLEASAKEQQASAEALRQLLGAGVLQLSELALATKEAVESAAAHSRSSLDILAQKADGLQGSQSRLFAAGEEAWRSRLAELEASVSCRLDEAEAAHRRRFDELLRLAPTRKVEELAAMVQDVAVRAEQAAESLGASLSSDLSAAIARAAAKSEGLHATAARQLADVEAAMQHRFEESASQLASSTAQLSSKFDASQSTAAKSVEVRARESAQRLGDLQALVEKRFDRTEQSALQAAQRSVQALAAFEQGLQRRLDEAMRSAAAEGAQQGLEEADRGAEKAIEALESAQRAELTAAVAGLLERLDDADAARSRKASEREERLMRNFEEMLEISVSRSSQKTEDVGLELKKELHGFAKRLNTKIAFM